MNTVGENNKIGIGVLTCNRLNLFKICISSIPHADIVIVINDGIPYPSSVYPSNIEKVLQHKNNLGVAKSKNEALRYLLKAGCRHIFLCEDDIKILNPDLCNEYIKASQQTGILHFNFAYHGPRNKTQDGRPNPRKILNYQNGVSICLNKNLVGAFSYYRNDVLIQSGLIDTNFRNVLDHVDHTYQIIKNGFHPPFWWFADLTESWKYIEDLDPTLSQSSIKHSKYISKILFTIFSFYFRFKNGYLVTKVPDVNENEIEYQLSILKNRNSVK